jgi:3-methyladenine DNA glycosylase/8-oxoguanine DNA glycosylase
MSDAYATLPASQTATDAGSVRYNLAMLTFDPDIAIAALSKADKRLAKIIRQAGPFAMRPERLQSVFHALFKAIVYQQLSGKAAGTIFGRVLALYPSGAKVTPEELLATDDEKLRGAGLSRNKLLAVKDLAQKTIDGIVPPLAKLRKLSDAEIIERLTQVRGIGPWTVEMLLIFRLGRPDVFPVTDLGVRRGYQLLHELEELPKLDELRTAGERWTPYRSVASWYLWRAVELLDKPKGK